MSELFTGAIDRPRGASRNWLMVLLGVGLVFIAVLRLPFIANVLIDEEGSFAYLVMGNRPVMQGADSILSGRLDGVDLLVPGGRTPMPYLFIDRVMRPLFGPGNVDGWSMAAISRATRLPYLAVFLIGCLVIAGFAARILAPLARPVQAAALLMLAYAMSAHLVVAGSIQPQLDGSIGVLVAALSSVLIVGGRRLGGPLATACGLASGLVTGLGKTEWAAALAGAVLTALALRWICARRIHIPAPEAREDTAVLLAALVGVAAALGAVAAFAPPGLSDGVDFATLIALTGDYRLTVFLWQLRDMYPMALLQAAALALALSRFDRLVARHLPLVVVLVWSGAIGAAYAFSGWSGDGFPRYFTPAIALVCVALIGMLATLGPPRWLIRAAIAGAALGLVVNAGELTARFVSARSITSIPGLPLADVERQLADMARRYAERRQVFFAWSSLGVYHREIEFIGSWLGEQGALDLLRQRRPGFTGELSRP